MPPLQVQCQRVGEMRERARSLPRLPRRSSSSAALVAPPLAHASGGAPFWAVGVAFIVVVVALYLLFAPTAGRLGFLRPKGRDSPPGASLPPSAEGDPQDGSAGGRRSVGR